MSDRVEIPPVSGRTYEAWVCPTCGAWYGGRNDLKEWGAWCDGACSHPKVKMERIHLVPSTELAALEEARALIETAEQDGYVSAGWREDARRWQNCWAESWGL